MAGITLQDFVVKLSYEIDQSTAKRFKDTMETGVHQMNEFRLALVAMAVGVEESIRRTIRSFSDLFFTSKGTGVPAKMLADLHYAANEVHISAKQLDSDLAGLYETLNTPGESTYLTTLTGHVENAGEAFLKLRQLYVEALKEGGGSEGPNSPVARLRIRMEGIKNVNIADIAAAARSDEIFVEGMKTRERVRARYRLNDKQASEQAQKAESAWNELSLTVTTGINKFIADNFEGITHAIEKLTDWIWTLGDAAKWVWNYLAPLRRDFGDWLDKLSDDVKRRDWKALGHDIWEGIVNGFGRFADWLGERFTDLSNYLRTIDWNRVGRDIGDLIAEAFGVEIQNQDLNNKLVKGFGDLAKTGLMIGEAIAAGISDAIEKQVPWIKTLEDFLNYMAGMKPREKGQPASPGPLPPAQPLKPGEPYLAPYGAPAGSAYQHGGIVPASLHPGEMVLPANISFGLQQMFSRSPGGGGFGGGDELTDEFKRWWSGDASFRPIVDLAYDVYDKFSDMFRTLGFGGGPGGGGPGGAPGAPGGPGGAPGGVGPEGGVAHPENVPIVAGVLEKAGLGKEAIAGFLGWMQSESGFDPRITNKSGHTGSMQWDPERWGRYTREFLPQHGGGDPYDIAKQTEYWLWEQEHTGESRYGVLARLRAAKTVAEANEAVGLSERSGNRYQGLQAGQRFLTSGWATAQAGAYGTGRGEEDRSRAPESFGVPVPGVPAAATADVVHLQSSFKDQLAKLVAATKAATGETVEVFSGFRSYAHQARLYAESGGSGMVAPPGHSMHNRGFAADLNQRFRRGLAYMHAHAAEFGLHFPMGKEPWHIEPLGVRRGAAPTSSQANNINQQTVNINVATNDPHAAAQDVIRHQRRQSERHFAAARATRDRRPFLA